MSLACVAAVFFAVLLPASARAAILPARGDGEGPGPNCLTAKEVSDDFPVDDWSVNLLQITLDRQPVPALASVTAPPILVPEDVVAAEEVAETAAGDAFLLVMLGMGIGALLALIVRELVAISKAKDSPMWYRRLSLGADVPEDFDPGESWEALGKFTRGVMRRKKLVIRCWVISAILGGLAVTQLSAGMSNTLTPSKGMPSYNDDRLFEAKFPGRARGASYALVIEGEQGKRILDTSNFERFSKELRDELNESGQLIEYDSNTTYWEENRIPAKDYFVSKDGQATFITWAINASVDSDKARFFGWMSKELVNKKIKELSGINFYGLTGLTYAVDDGVKDLERVLIFVDCLVTPVVVCVLWWMLGTWRLLVIPGTSLMVSTMMTAGMISVSSKLIKIHTAAPSLMMCILVAMGMDYSLFILTRFKEELKAARAKCIAPKVDLNEVISKTMQTAGFMVVASGFLLFITVSMLTLFPIGFIQSIGVAAMAALGNTVLVNLTLPPALLASYPEFFSAIEDDAEPDEAGERRGAGGLSDGGPASSSGGKRSTGKGLFVTPSSGKASLVLGSPGSKVGGGRVYSAAWIRVAQTVTTWPGNALAIAASVVLVAFVGIFAFDMQTSNDLDTLMPRGTQALEAFKRLRFHFGAGTIAPYMVMMHPAEGGTIMNEEFWQASQTVLHSFIRELPKTDPDTFIFPSFVSGRDVPWLLVRTCEGFLGGSDRLACKYPHFLLGHFANQERTAMWGYIRTGFDPFSHEGVEWLEQLRKVSEDHLATSKVKVVIAGVGTNYNDVTTAMDEAFPYIASANLLAVMIVSGLVFGSVFVPLVQTLSIVSTLMVCYGISVLVYQFGALEWSGMDCVGPTNGGVPSMAPVISFPFMVGLCLDYDVFLLTRIREFRTYGMHTSKAIQHALCSTASIISVAGFIMAFTFSGLMVSGMGIINTNAFILFVAIFYDAFFVRTMLMPAVQSALGSRIWWPSDLSGAMHLQKNTKKLGVPGPGRTSAATVATDKAMSAAPSLPRAVRSRSPSPGSHGAGGTGAAMDPSGQTRDLVRRGWLGCCRRRDAAAAPGTVRFPAPGARDRSLQLVDADWECLENVSVATIQDLLRMVAEVEDGQWGSPDEESPQDYDLYVKDDPNCPVPIYAALVAVDRNDVSLQDIMDAAPYSCIATHLSNGSKPCIFTPLFECTATKLIAPPGRRRPSVHIDQLNVVRRAFGLDNERTNHHIACDFAECTNDDGTTCYAWTFVGVHSPAVEELFQARPALTRKVREKAKTAASPDDGVLVNHIVGVVVREVNDEWRVGVVMKIDPGLPFFAPRWAAEQSLRGMIQDCTNGVLKDLLGERHI